ncbi:MAG: hypothetical protein ABF876_05120 [Acetobacter aceti]
MSGISVVVLVDGQLVDTGISGADLFPHLAYAVGRIAEAAQKQWQAYAHGAPLPDGKSITNRTGEYARSILMRDTGDFSAEVYSDLAYAQAIEEGTPAYDLKRMLNTSLKVRVSKKGRRYLIIPFRWGTPGSVMGRNMTEAVHDWWSGKVSSAITGKYRRLSGTGVFDIRTRKRVTVPGWRYKWGDRLGHGDLEQMGHIADDKIAKRMAGMVNFRKPGSSGGSAHSKFLTFRVMAEGAPGWVRPAQPGRWPARTAAEQIQPVAEEAFKAAAEADVKAYLG